MDGRLTLRFGSNRLICFATQEAVNEDEEERIVSLRNLMPECIDLLCPVLAIQPELVESTWIMDLIFLINIQLLS